MRRLLWVLIIILMACGVHALGLETNDTCYTNTPGVTIYFGSIDPFVLTDFGIQNTCVGTAVQWDGVTNLTVLGNVTNEEVVLTRTSVYVDSFARPDLDKSATIIFYNSPFAVEPKILRDGLPCMDCNSSYNARLRLLIVNVTGFSNYTIFGRNDFYVYSDPQPELKGKTYMTLDLGDSNRNEEFSCIVQIYAPSSEGSEMVLVQTNPQRQVQARMFGSPDPNQPESLGYFPTKNGVANVYFDGSTLAGFSDFTRVIQCSSNSTKLIDEELISTRYSPMGRSITARGIWLSNGNNMMYLVFTVVGLLILTIILVSTYRRVKGR